jgi:hypothetical protein
MTEHFLASISLPSSFDDASRIWMYQCDRDLTEQEILDINQKLQGFITRWNTHGKPVKGFATVLFNRFILIMADESNFAVSGCSIDSSVAVIREIERKHQIDLFNRSNLAFLLNDSIVTLPLNEMTNAIKTGMVSANTLYFNNTIQYKQEWQSAWIVPVQQTWLSKYLA